MAKQMVMKLHFTNTLENQLIMIMNMTGEVQLLDYKILT